MRLEADEPSRKNGAGCIKMDYRDNNNYGARVPQNSASAILGLIIFGCFPAIVFLYFKLSELALI